MGINDSVILPNVSYFDVSCAHVDGPSVGSEPLLDISKLTQTPHPLCTNSAILLNFLAKEQIRLAKSVILIETID